MNIAQEIKLLRIIKKAEDIKKELKDLAYHGEPLNSAELDNVESALALITKLINTL